jgi:hypothetical protein
LSGGFGLEMVADLKWNHWRFSLEYAIMKVEKAKKTPAIRPLPSAEIIVKIVRKPFMITLL